MGLEGFEYRCRSLLDALTGGLDVCERLLTTTTPRGDVSEGVVACVKPKRLTHYVRRRFGLELGKTAILERIVQNCMCQFVGERLDTLRGELVISMRIL